jgi:hypothetical protein
MISNNKSSANEAYMDLLEKELPTQDLEGANMVQSKHMHFENLKQGQ